MFLAFNTYPQKASGIIRFFFIIISESKIVAIKRDTNKRAFACIPFHLIKRLYISIDTVYLCIGRRFKVIDHRIKCFRHFTVKKR